MAFKRPALQQGMTLIELMIVTCVVAILAAIAIPNYRQYVLRTNRSSAKVALTQAASRLERCYTRYNAYNATPNLGDTECTFTAANTPDNLYRISFTTPTANTYVVTATPQGAQASDTKCANFTLNELNSRQVTGTSIAAPNECWGK